jgi:hypothetical protein
VKVDPVAGSDHVITLAGVALTIPAFPPATAPTAGADTVGAIAAAAAGARWESAAAVAGAARLDSAADFPIA